MKVVKITVVLAGTVVHEGVAENALRHPPSFYASCTLFPVDEGITWIRGWHVESSEEAQALLAAHRLDQRSMPRLATLSGRWRGVPGPETPARPTIPRDAALRFHPIHRR